MASLLPENLRRSADVHASRTAIDDGRHAVTYAALFGHAAAFARALGEAGVSQGDRVAIVLPNSVDYVAALYGTWLAGGIAVPLYSGARSRDYAIWLAHSEPRVIVAAAGSGEVQAALEESRLDAVVLDPASVPRDGNHSTTGSGLQLPSGSEPAAILYTSGTTGRPKGVTLSHDNLASNTDAIIESLGMQDGDSMVMVLPFSFAYGNSVLHTHIKVGGRLILENSLVYPHKVVQRLQDERATGFAGVPSTFSLLLSRVNLKEYDLSPLRYLTQAGGPMPVAVINRLRETLPHSRLFVMYGQTEAAARLTCMPPGHLDDRIGSVGVAIPGTQVEIRNPGPDGTGEIWARGPGIMLGYWRDPERTRETLQDGWLKTGDMGRMEDGFLYVVGRRSDIIKVGANRVHPADIEEVIAELPEVREVLALGVPDEILGQAIKVYIVPQDGADLPKMKVQAHCRARLASYKIPKQVELVASLPKTPSGKLRRVEISPQENA